MSSVKLSKAEKADRIALILDQLYPDPPIPLAHVDPFTLLVAVILSAQTTDKKVNEVTPKLFKRAKTPKQLAKLSVKEIQEIIHEIGLAPQKAKALHELGKILEKEHGGHVPPDFNQLVELPGVGRKTANVVMAQAFGEPSFPVDTHIHRLSHRWGLSNGKTPDQVEIDLKRLFPKDVWNRLHLQIIYFGREHCPARYHDLSTCAICAWAASKARIRQEAKMNQRAKKARSTSASSARRSES